jgi:hypothetical protein
LSISGDFEEGQNVMQTLRLGENLENGWGIDLIGVRMKVWREELPQMGIYDEE